MEIDIELCSRKVPLTTLKPGQCYRLNQRVYMRVTPRVHCFTEREAAVDMHDGCETLHLGSTMVDPMDVKLVAKFS